MKYLSLIGCLSLLAMAAPVPSARADVSVPVDFFYDALSPYGDWVYTDNYGYVWEPAVAQQQPGWAPYADGYWAYTDAGWTWISNEDFGWATYHYGRWIRMFSNWFWVPGYEWAPAWVSWRQSDNYIGWAPLPPEARWSSNIGFQWWTDSYYDIGPGYYNFVPIGSFATRSSLRPLIVDRSRNTFFIDQSRNITNIRYRQNVVNNIFVGGPDPARIARFGNPVRHLTLRRDDDDFRRQWLDRAGHDHGRGRDGHRSFDSLSRIERDQLIVAAPNVRRENAPSLPPRVREKLDRPEIDRGWRNVGDAQAAERLRHRQREELAKARDEKMPDKAPNIVTSKKPPPAVGRELRPEERQLVERPSPNRVDEEVRKAQPQPQPGTPTPPKVADEPPARPGAPGRDASGNRAPENDRAETDRRRPGAPRADEEDRVRPSRPGEGPGGRTIPRDHLGAGPRGNEFRPVPPGVVPNEGGDRRRGGMPSRPEQPPTNPEPRAVPPPAPPPRGSDPRPDKPVEGLRPTPPGALNPPRAPVPMPEARPNNRVRPNSMPSPEAPRVRPAPMPQPQTPPQVRPSFPDRPAPSRPSLPKPAQPQGRPSGGNPGAGHGPGGGGHDRPGRH